VSLAFDERDRRSVVRDLSDADAEVRRLAVERIVALPAEDALPLLVERLGDESWRVRKAAVERIVALPEGARCAEALIGALADGENPGRRNAAVEALVSCGTRALSALVEAVRCDDPDVRKLVVDAMAGIADEGAAETLLRLLRDPDSNVRGAAADALGAIGGERAQDALRVLSVRDDEERLVRLSALRALSALDASMSAEDLGTVLDDPILRPAGLDLLGLRDDAGAMAALLKWLGSGSRASREAAIRSLLRLLARMDGARAERLVAEIRAAATATPSVVRSAVERLGEADLATRLSLIQFLGLTRRREVVVPILRAGCDEALAEVALASLEALGEVTERAIDDAWTDLETGARRDACILFGRTRGERSAARLLCALDERDSELRAAAARSIGARRLAAALPLLVRRLSSAACEDEFEGEEELAALTEAVIAVADPGDDGDPGATERAVTLLADRLEGAVEPVRLAIAEVLGRIGRRRDLPIASFLAKDPSARVRRAAVLALARIDAPAVSESLRLALADESPLVRIAAAGALATCASEEIAPDLERLLADPDDRVRAAVVRVIGGRIARGADPEWRSHGIACLDAALEQRPLVALAAVEALHEIGPPLAERVAALLSRPEPELVKEAAACLSAHAETSSLDAVVPLLSHPDWSVRAEAVAALADRRVVRAVPAILRRLDTEQDEFVRSVILRALARLEG
jgi:HEAT repeat protein